MFVRIRSRLFILVLVAIIITFLAAVELFGDEVVRVVSHESKISQRPGTLREEIDSLDAEPLPEAYSQSSRTYEKEEPMPPGHDYTRTVVIGKRTFENTDWVAEELTSFSKAIYIVDNRTAPLTVPANKGNEAMVYLTYIIEHYDILSDITIFLHSSRWSWHNNDFFDNDSAFMLKHLFPQRVIREGYVNLRCSWFPGCPSWLNTSSSAPADPQKREQPLIPTLWPQLFPTAPLPLALAAPCCSQFALSRSRIRSVPRAEYERLRAFILATRTPDDLLGRVFEYVWQYLWTGAAVVCPGQHSCYCDLYGACFDDEEEFQAWFEGRWRIRVAEREVEQWRVKEEERNELLAKGDGGRAEQVVLAPEGRVEELMVEIDRWWMKLLERRKIALEKGKDGEHRARIAGRKVDRGDGVG
jgi:uncharacterized protein DUF3431